MSQVFQNTLTVYSITTSCLWCFVLSLLGFIHFSWQKKQKCSQARSWYKQEKVPTIKKVEAEMLAMAVNKPTFPSISYLIGRVLSIFRQKIDRLNRSEMDIKVFIPAPTIYLQPS